MLIIQQVRRLVTKILQGVVHKFLKDNVFPNGSGGLIDFLPTDCFAPNFLPNPKLVGKFKGKDFPQGQSQW